MNTKVIEIKEYRNDDIGLFVQVILTEWLFIFCIINMITDIFYPVFYALIVMTMFTLAYNNAKTYKKKYMTPVYIIVGFFVLITTIVEYLF